MSRGWAGPGAGAEIGQQGLRLPGGQAQNAARAESGPEPAEESRPEHRERPPRGVIIIDCGDNTVIRTQISLDEKAYREAKAEARRQGISLAEFLRRAVRLALPAGDRGERPWMRYGGAVASGDPEASQTVDAVVYGRPRP